MRKWIWPILVLVMLAGTYAAVQWRRYMDAKDHAVFSRAAGARRAIEREIRIRAATGDVKLNGRGWPQTVDPTWFSANPPLNPMIASDHPWVEIASTHEEQLTDPAIRQALTRDVAAFWYNPATGAVRARVGPNVTDAAAIEIYNRLNGSAVDSLFESGVTVNRPMYRGARTALSRSTEAVIYSRN